jgi:hypothetical protein
VRVKKLWKTGSGSAALIETAGNATEGIEESLGLLDQRRARGAKQEVLFERAGAGRRHSTHAVSFHKVVGSAGRHFG